MTATYTPIHLEEMTRVLRREQGWALIEPFNTCNEYVFEWAIPQAQDLRIRVYTSIDCKTNVSRKSGADAIRVCAVRLVGPNTNGWIATTRVHRVQGWATTLHMRVSEVLESAMQRLATENAKAKANTTAPQAGLSAVISKLNVAHGNGLKFPKLRFKVDGQPVVIARIASGANEGKANITDGRPFGANLWFGRVEADGSLRKGGALKDPAFANVAKFLDTLGADVLGIAKAHGHATGNCCFCGRDLTTAESVTAGYGPVCADKWSLPWGHVNPELASPKAPVEINTKD